MFCFIVFFRLQKLQRVPDMPEPSEDAFCTSCSESGTKCFVGAVASVWLIKVSVGSFPVHPCLIDLLHFTAYPTSHVRRSFWFFLHVLFSFSFAILGLFCFTVFVFLFFVSFFNLCLYVCLFHSMFASVCVFLLCIFASSAWASIPHKYKVCSHKQLVLPLFWFACSFVSPSLAKAAHATTCRSH